MITIAIVEDEEAYAKQLTEYIEKYQQESGRRWKDRYGGYRPTTSTFIRNIAYQKKATPQKWPIGWAN